MFKTVNYFKLRNGMNEYVYRKMIRRKFCKRILWMSIVFGISFYITVLLIGDPNYPKIMHLTDLRSCPACYGISACSDLYSNQITAVKSTSLQWQERWFNQKNIYRGYTKHNRPVIFKKLAHDQHFKEFDAKLCQTWSLGNNCKPVDLMSIDTQVIEDKIKKEVIYDPLLRPNNIKLVFCPYADNVLTFLKSLLNKDRNGQPYKIDLINIWTMLTLNPEPIIIQMIPKHKGWSVPAFGGVCGRLEVLADEGISLSSLKHMDFKRKLLIAKQILNMAMDFTFKHEQYRFYPTDWSLDNLVVNEKDQVSFVDLEDVIVLDKNAYPNTDFLKWTERHHKEDTEINEYGFSVDDLCKHHLSDYNLWAACYVLGGGDSPYLYPLNKSEAQLDSYIQDCIRGTVKNRDRFQHISQLIKLITDKLLLSNVVT